MKKRLYDDYNYEDIYDKPIESESLDDLRINNNYVYVRQTVKSKKYIECSIYPTWKCKGDIPRGKKKKESSKKQKKLNLKNRIKNITRYLHTNFTTEDLFMTLTYRDMKGIDEERAYKDITNYIKKIRRWMKKNKITKELKYMYIISYDNNPTSEKKIRIHHHIVISGIDRDAAEKLWGKGIANARRLQEGDFGFSELGKYFAEQEQNPKEKDKVARKGKRFGHSLNLKKPIITKDRTTLTRRKVETIAKNENDYKEFFENKYPGCRFIDCQVYMSDEFSGIYLYARLIKEDEVKKE